MSVDVSSAFLSFSGNDEEKAQGFGITLSSEDVKLVNTDIIFIIRKTDK